MIRAEPRGPAFGDLKTDMEKFRIKGSSRPLSGTVRISGAKNAALPILFGTVLTDEDIVLHNVPVLRDVKTALRLLELTGKTCVMEGNDITIKGGISDHVAPYELVKTMRASIMALGPILTRQGIAMVSLPGGCAIGARPVDLHIRGLEEMGAKINVESTATSTRGPRAASTAPQST